MGEGVFGHITKGPVHQLVDKIVNSGTRMDFLAKVKAAANPDDYITVLRNAGLDAESADYLRTRWYNLGPTGQWAYLQPIYPILKAGLVKAIELVEAEGLKLDSYWSPAGTQVEVIVVKSAWQVTRIIMTPPPFEPIKQRTKETDMWIVRRGSPGWKKDDKTKDEIVESVDGDIITWRTLGL
jgi:hypothetical protein